MTGRSGYGNFLAGLYNMELARQLTPYDRHIGRKLAYVSFERGNSAIYIQELATGSREVVSAAPGIASCHSTRTMLDAL